jgi:hypothetical protein
MSKWFQDGLVLIPHWSRAVKQEAYITHISNKQRSLIASFPDDGGRNIGLLFDIDAAGRLRRFYCI